MTEVELCPMCKKPTLREIMGFQLGINFRCTNCGYQGPLRLIVEDKKKR